MYRKIKKQIKLQADKMVPNKWQEINNQAVEMLHAPKPVTLKYNIRKCVKFAACFGVIIAFAVVTAFMSGANLWGTGELQVNNSVITNEYNEIDQSGNYDVNKDYEGNNDIVTKEADSSNENVNYALPEWSQRFITEQFQTIVFNSNDYISPGSQKKHNTINYVENLVGDQTITHTDSNTGINHEVSIKIYTLKNIDPLCAVGVKFENVDGVYPYVNMDYSINTLNDLLMAIDFKETVSFGVVEYYDINNNSVVEKNIEIEDVCIFNYLTENDTAKNVGDIDLCELLFTVRVDCPAIGMTNMALSVYEEGYIETNILGSGCVFYVGRDCVEEFVIDSLGISLNEIDRKSNVSLTQSADIQTAEGYNPVN